MPPCCFLLDNRKADSAVTKTCQLYTTRGHWVCEVPEAWGRSRLSEAPYKKSKMGGLDAGSMGSAESAASPVCEV